MGTSAERPERSSATTTAAAAISLVRLRQNQSCYPNETDTETDFHVMRLPRSSILIKLFHGLKEKSAEYRYDLGRTSLGSGDELRSVRSDAI
jgi:hypothetical protein